MKILKQLKKFSLVTVVLGFISGILFIAYPDKCIKYISLAVGISMICLAIYGIVGYIINKNTAFALVGGVILGLTGIIVCIKYEQVISLIVAVLGLFILSAGITNLVAGFKVIKRSLVFGWTTLFLSIATIVFGFISLTHSADVSIELVRLIGIGLIVYAVIDLIVFFEVRSLFKEINDAVEQELNEQRINEHTDDAKVTEVDDFTEVINSVNSAKESYDSEESDYKRESDIPKITEVDEVTEVNGETKASEE